MKKQPGNISNLNRDVSQDWLAHPRGNQYPQATNATPSGVDTRGSVANPTKIIDHVPIKTSNFFLTISGIPVSPSTTRSLDSGPNEKRPIQSLLGNWINNDLTVA